jgi:hypothetical protein
MITQDVTKEEKDQGVKGSILGNAQVFILGNAQVFWRDDSNQKQQARDNGISQAGHIVGSQPQQDDFDDAIPF